MNPVRAFRILRDVAGRRPVLVGLIGAGMLAEAARVGGTGVLDRAVTVFGHSGADVWSTAEAGPEIAALAAWLAACGVILIGIAIAAALRRRGAATSTPGDAEAAPRTRSGPMRGARPAGRVAERTAGGAVVWRRGGRAGRPNQRAR
jgi:hypothetical protein